AYETAVRYLDALDAVHELTHQKQAAPILAVEVLGRGRIGHGVVEIEAGSLVHDFDDESLGIDERPNVHVLRRVVSVSAQDGVGERLRERDGDVEHDLASPEIHLLAFTAHEL